MKRMSFLLAFMAAMYLSFGLAQGTTEIVLESMTGLSSGDTVWADSSVKWTFRFTYTPGTGDSIRSSSNGFRVWTHRGGVYTQGFSVITADTLSVSWTNYYDGGLFINPFLDTSDGSHDVDTVGFGGFAIMKAGIVDGFDAPVWWVETTPSTDGDTLCVDSSLYQPGGQWLWSTTPAGTSYPPDWGGPYCFHVYDPSTGVKVLDGLELPTTYSLGQNYPNPFNPTTAIDFEIPVRSHVTLTVYNVVGQKVKTLVDRELSPNRYVADWDGTSDYGRKVASGVYFYKLEASDFIETKKMLYLK